MKLDLTNEAVDSRVAYSGGANGTRVNSALAVVAASTPRTDRAALLVEEQRTNLITYSQDFSNAAWSKTGTPTVETAATLGDLSLDLLGDDNAAELEYFWRAVTYTGDGQKALSFYVKQGTATSSVFRMYDASASATRAFGVITWDGSAPVVTMTTGTAEIEAMTGGVYRVKVVSSAITAANTNSIEIFPATNAALSATLTGTVYSGGVQPENATASSSYIKTTTAAVTRTADSATFAWTQAEGTYAVEFDLLAVTGTRPIFSLDDASADNQIRLYANGTSLMLSVTTGGVARDLTLGTVAANTTYKAAFSIFANDVQALMNGGVLQTNFTAATSPIVTTARIGSDQAGNYQNGHSKRIRQWKTRKGLYQLVA